MLEVDFHSHTSFSKCGCHTIIEMLTRGRELGMRGMAITDHGPALGCKTPSPFWDRLHDPVPGIRLLKGMECNVLDETGRIDLPMPLLPYMDIVLLGIHPNIESGKGIAFYTEMLLAAIKKNPWVDIVTHPNDETYRVDFDAIAAAAAGLDIVVELNNSKNMLGRVDEASTLHMLEACKNAKCCIAIDSDAHVIGEVGLDDTAQQFIKRTAFPREYIVNRDAAAAFEFVERRRAVKQRASHPSSS